MIVVCAVLKTVDGKGDEVASEIKKVVPSFLRQPGTIDYAVHRAINDPNKILIYEKYEDRDALTAHSSTEHFKEMGRKIGPMLSGRAEVEMYNLIT